MRQGKNTYHFPFIKNTIVEEISTASPAHTGAFQGAVDFLVPLGTSVAASLNGKVIDANDTNTRHGNDPKFADEANYITLKHENGEFSQYVHLATNSLRVKIGDKVKTGQVIATTGLSGWMSAPHLHMFVFRRTKRKPGFKGLNIKFKT